MSEHTETPWVAMRTNGGFAIMHGAFPRVAFVHDNEGAGEANAALIVAAPDLYDALKRLYEETADYITINHLGDVHHNRSMRDARDALSKAKAAP